MSLEMPYDKDLEDLLIGNVLLNKRLTVEDKTVSVVDFYSTVNQRIWQVFCEMDEDGESIEISDVQRRVALEHVTMSALGKMCIGLVGDTRPEDIKALKDLATLRELIRTYAKLARMAEKKETVENILAENSQALDQIQNEQEKRHGTSQSLVEVMEREVFPRLDKFVSGEMVKVPFGFTALDASSNGGASLGELVVLGALPKSGKSVMLTQIARQQAEQGIPTYMASLEMLNYENGFRFLAQSSDFSMNIFRPDMYADTARRLKDHARATYDIPYRLDQKSRNLREIGNEIARLKDNADVISAFVDYVQLIGTEKRIDNRAAKIEEIIYGLKDLAMKHEIVVYTAAQFNREGIKSEKPSMAHFDGSSAIEKAANLILMWTLEKDYNPEKRGREGKLWIEAGRSIACDSFDVIFHGADARFTVL